MKERLIKLFMTEVECNKGGEGDCETCEYKYLNKDCERHISELLADLFLANGVIAPPCKVGDTVYMPWKWHGVKGIAILQVMWVIVSHTRAYVRTDFITDDEDYFEAYGCGEFEFTDFGKTVFLTHEEAEKHLKGERE